MRRDDEHGGYPLGNPFRRRHEADDPLGATNETPVDLAAVQADDALLDMLGGAEVARGEADADLARVLVEWRRDVDLDPIPADLIDTTTALRVILEAQTARPTLGPWGGFAAAVVVSAVLWFVFLAVLMRLVT